jgi:demethylmenaquinone methyltransferase/2-methoxy-6-polyprenyl-1,4-benzoquinol methylase
MLRIAAATEPGPNVRFAEADIFSWRPERRYDCVFFGFWLSHVPEQRFEAFWETVAEALAPGGVALFVDDGYRGPEELVYGESSSVIERRGDDGSPFRIIKVGLTAERLGQRLSGLGWEVQMHDRDPFFWGIASRQPDSAPR